VEGFLFGVSVLWYPKSKDPTSGEEKDHIDDLGWGCKKDYPSVVFGIYQDGAFVIMTEGSLRQPAAMGWNARTNHTSRNPKHRSGKWIPPTPCTTTHQWQA
jgi:hypothetical protein